MPYPEGEYPDVMVQLSVAQAVSEWNKWNGRKHPLEAKLKRGLEKFYDPGFKTLRRYLPSVGEKEGKDPDAVDSWYLYHPMLNLGLTDRASAGKVLTEQVGFSEAMTKQELDRYMFNAPGQAGSYFYGYSRILELRMDTELALGDRFDRLSFNNFLLDQGLLPPALLGKAVREDYVPKLKGAEKGKGKGKSKSKSKNK